MQILQFTREKTMKRFFVRWMLIAIALFLTSPAFAQTIAFSDGFESGDLSNGWTQSSVSTNPPLWSVGGTGISGVTAAHQGTAYAWVASSTPSAHALLQSGLIDIAMFDDAELSFALIMPEYSGGVHDTLRVYMRSTSTANWSLVSVCDAAMASWNQLSIPLTNYLGGNVQIGFEFTCGGGRGVGLDNVEVKLVSNCFQPNALKGVRVTHNSAERNGAAHRSALPDNLKESRKQRTGMPQTGGGCDGCISVKPHVLSSLNSSTTYYFYVLADCYVNV